MLAFSSECEPGRNIICPGMVTAICDQEEKTLPKCYQPRNGRSKEGGGEGERGFQVKNQPVSRSGEEPAHVLLETNELRVS